MASQDISSPASEATNASTPTPGFNPGESKELIEGKHYRIENGKYRCTLPKCEGCDKSFSRKNGLLKHIRQALGYRDYKCEKCPMRFSQSAHLKTHMNQHTGTKIDCGAPGCSFQATDPSSVARHKKTSHGTHSKNPRKRTPADNDDNMALPPATRQRTSSPRSVSSTASWVDHLANTTKNTPPAPSSSGNDVPDNNMDVDYNGGWNPPPPPPFEAPVQYGNVYNPALALAPILAFNNATSQPHPAMNDNDLYVLGVQEQQRCPEEGNIYAGDHPGSNAYMAEPAERVEPRAQQPEDGQYDSQQQPVAPAPEAQHVEIEAIDPRLLDMYATPGLLEDHGDPGSMLDFDDYADYIMTA